MRHDGIRGRREKETKKKRVSIQILEYLSVSSLLIVCRALPAGTIRGISRGLGGLLYHLSRKRRGIAIRNLKDAYGGSKTEEEIRGIARQSCTSFFLTFLEIIRSRALLAGPQAMDRLRETTEGLDALFLKARRIHDESGGCIFVTPHIGNWEVLPAVSAVAGIPLVLVVRPLDNPYLERLLYAQRSESGQVIIPKKNALFVLQRTLRQGRSVGLLPDQSTMKGISVDFFGHKATTTPVPALLAVHYGRPVVVVACCRKPDGRHYEGFVSEPIWPGEYTSEKAEVFRITEEMNREMESIIRHYPEQYLWMHNRWKTYRQKRALMLKEEPEDVMR